MPSAEVRGARKRTSKSKKHRKYGRSHRNGRPFGMKGGCGCITCRARVKEMC